MSIVPGPFGFVPLDAQHRIVVDIPCVGCAYNLRGMEPAGACPECGRSIAESLRLVSIPLDAQNHLAMDLPCVGCAYNLRGMETAGVCPECGQSISESLRPSRLIFAPLPWLDRLAYGARLMAIACGGPYALSVLVDLSRSFVLMWFGAAAIVAMCGVAVHLLTGHEPEVQGANNSYFASRNIARRAGIGATIAFGGVLLLLPSERSLFSAPQVIIALFLCAITLLLLTIGIPAMFLYFRSLFLRIPNRRYARDALILAWLSGGYFGFVFIQIGLIWLNSLGWIGNMSLAGSTISLFQALFAVLPFAIPGIGAVAMFTYYRRLRRIRREYIKTDNPFVRPLGAP